MVVVTVLLCLMNLAYYRVVVKMPSNYFSRLGIAIQRSFGIQESAEILIGQGKLWFGGSRFFHSVDKSSCVGIALASSSETELVGKRKTLSVVDTLSRTFSTPSASGPSFQVCGYHINCALSGPDKFSAGTGPRIKTMAAHLPWVAVGGCSLDDSTLKGGCRSLSTKNSSNICLSAGLKNGGKVSMSLKNQQQLDNRAIYGYFVYNVAKNWRGSFRYTQSGSGDFHSLSTSCHTVGPAHDVPFDTSAREERLANSADSSEQYVVSPSSVSCSPL